MTPYLITSQNQINLKTFFIKNILLNCYLQYYYPFILYANAQNNETLEIQRSKNGKKLIPYFIKIPKHFERRWFFLANDRSINHKIFYKKLFIAIMFVQ